MTDKLIEIARAIDMTSAAETLEAIRQRANDANTPLLIPLVGEFSSDKTSLINALTDSQVLETATRPTTATIYEVHFGAPATRAQVVNEAGEVTEVNDMAQLKNEALADARTVAFYDTSTRVPSSLVLVDTPGLSSPDARHRQTLVRFLPQSDCALLVTDINQLNTRSFEDFVHDAKLLRKPLYLLLTKSDTKAPSERERAKQYAQEHDTLGVKGIYVVSAKKGDFSELLTLFANLQAQKRQIIQRVDAQRTADLKQEMTARINELLEASQGTEQMDQAIRQCEIKLTKMNRNIDRTVDEFREDIQDLAREASHQFEDAVEPRLMSLADEGGQGIDRRAMEIVNKQITLTFASFKRDVSARFASKASRLRGTDDEVPMQSLQDINMSNYDVEGIDYNLNLDATGHEYDKYIKNGIKIVGTAIATFFTGGAAAGGAAKSGLLKMGSNLIKNPKVLKTVTKGAMTAKANWNLMRMEPTQGFLDRVTGWFSDNLLGGKDKRTKAVREYIYDTLVPQFQTMLDNIADSLTEEIESVLTAEAEGNMAEARAALEKMKQEQAASQAEYEKRVAQLNAYKAELNNPQ